MPAENGKKDAHRSDVPENWFDGQKRFCVVLEEIRSDVETPESFAIKFSLLTKTPISKVKHIVNNLPAPIWSGQGRVRAESILALIDEAGGKGTIAEGGAPSAKSSAAHGKSRPSCRWCGFPLKEGDAFCDFCATPVADAEKGEFHWEGKGDADVIPPKRLLCYVVILVAGIIFAIISR